MQPDKIMFLDLEVENNPYFGAIASPKHKDNYVVMQGYAVEDEPYSGKVEFDYYANQEKAKDWLKIPDDVWLVVAHNLPFEIDWAYTQCYEELMKFIKRGGMFWCTQLAEYRLSRQRELYPSLNETCVKYGGNTKLDLVAVEWELGKLTSQIDPDLLRDYLIGFESPEGFQEGDIGNTRLSFYGQYALMQERGMLDIFFAQMDGLLYNAICMSNGLKIDREYAEEQLKVLTQDSKDTEAKLAELRHNIPAEFREQFNSGSLHHRSAWLYGGAFKFEGREETFNKDGSPKWEKKSVVYKEDKSNYVEVTNVTEECLEEFVELWKTIPSLGFEPTRYKSGKNKGKIKVERIDSEVRATRKCDVVVQVQGLINLEDYSQEFREDFLKDYTTKLELADGTPVLGTSEEAVDKFINHPSTPKEVKEMLEVLKHKYVLDKILGTFFITYKYNKDGSVRSTNGMLQYVTDEDLVHHNLNATSTVTGRLSCSRPNLQQTTTKLGVNRLFSSRFGEKGRIVSIDYSNLEVITLANFSRDEFLMQQIRENMNAHNINSAWKLGITYEAFMEVRNNEEHPLWAEYDAVRDDMKGYEFLYNYGGSAKGLVFNKGCTMAEAEAFIQYKAESLVGVTKYYDAVEKSIRDSAVNVREFRNDSWQLAQEGMFKADGGFEYSYRTYETFAWENGKKFSYQDFKIPQIKNYHMQGESSLFVQVGCGKVVRYLASKNFYEGKLLPISTTHDENLFDVHEDVLDKLKDIVYIMEGVSDWMRPLGYDLPLPYPVAVSTGLNMQDQHVLEFN